MFDRRVRLASGGADNRRVLALRAVAFFVLDLHPRLEGFEGDPLQRGHVEEQVPLPRVDETKTRSVTFLIVPCGIVRPPFQNSSNSPEPRGSLAMPRQELDTFRSSLPVRMFLILRFGRFHRKAEHSHILNPFKLAPTVRAIGVSPCPATLWRSLHSR